MEECSICLEIMETDIILLTCLHKFHTSCILLYKAIYKNKPCPICRVKSTILSRCNIKKNKDGSISYTLYKIPETFCCNIL